MAALFRAADLRVNLLLMAVNAAAVILCKGEGYFTALLAAACLWLLLRQKPVRALKFAALYAALSGFAALTIGKQSLITVWMFSNILRHMLIPIAYADGLADAPTGTLLAVFQALRMPKSFGISTVVLLRFMPTITGEFRAIRNSLRFRNVGVGFFSTMLHIPANFERTMVPMLIRVTRIAEELSAAAMVRGVRLTNSIVSIDEVAFRGRDLFVALAFALFAGGVCAAERLALFS